MPKIGNVIEILEKKIIKIQYSVIFLSDKKKRKKRKTIVRVE